MELVLFIGIPACGKSTFFRERFFDTHVRINLDMLRTRHRERLLFNACLEAKQRVVVDNTNVLASERSLYIRPARDAGFRVIGYFFEAELRAALRRNKQRSRVVPIPGLISKWRGMQPPAASEGFDELWIVRIEPYGFAVEPLTAVPYTV